MTPEGQVQKAIFDYCKLKGLLVFKHRNVGIYKKATDSYIPLSYGEKGISDIIGCLRKGESRGHILAIEVKAPGKKPSREQLEFIERVKADGGVAFWCDSLEEAICLLSPYV